MTLTKARLLKHDLHFHGNRAQNLSETFRGIFPILLFEFVWNYHSFRNHYIFSSKTIIVAENS